jgi:hypothetical protein
MPDSNLFRWSAVALVAAGLTTAIFWILTVPFESFASAETAWWGMSHRRIDAPDG